MMPEDSTKLKAKRVRTAVAISAVIAAVAALVCLWYVTSRAYAEELDPEMYTSIGRDAEGRPTATVDVDAILRDYGLPNPTNVDVQAGDYAEVAALCSMKVTATYAETDGFLHVSLAADTETLHRCGILLVKSEWDQALPPMTSDLWTGETDAPPAAQTPAEETAVMEEGYLSLLLDGNAGGLNLRSVCERVQSERDKAANAAFGEEYTSTKISISFLVDSGGAVVRNIYRVVYRISEKTENADTRETTYLSVDVVGLKWTAASGVGFSAVRTETYETQAAATDLTDYLDDGYTVTKLSGGGVVVEDKVTFDQNGFVRFTGRPTSFMLANGVYWSPTYNLLTEDAIWKLTATEERSLVNLLRYARREIYARHGLTFDADTEKEFYDFYHRYAWYRGSGTDVEDLLTDNEKQNVRLLREIQSLLEN